MINEPKTMREIHEIRVRNYESERGLLKRELSEKRRNDKIEVERVIAEFGLNVSAGVNVVK